MDLNISKMEQFSKVQIECLEMMNENSLLMTKKKP